MGSEDYHHPGVEYVKGHTKDISKLLPNIKPKYIFHMGEYSRIEVSFDEPDVCLDLNTVGTIGVVEFWRKNGGKLIYAGSSTKFADQGEGKDQSPYAWSKCTNTTLINNYGKWFSLPYAITYFYNVYGPKERAGKYGTVIEIFRRLQAENKDLTVTAPGTQERIFTHIDDIVKGLLLVAEKGDGDGFELGAEEAYSILDLAKLWGQPIIMGPERKGNRMKAYQDLSKSYALGWKAEWKVEDYIEQCKQKVAAQHQQKE